MGGVNILNDILYVAIGCFAILLARKGEWVTAISLGALALHGFAFNAVYVYRDLYWETCPPLCGLQEWSPILRMHALIAILTSMLYRLYVKPC
jgi:hypothetical protein